MIRDLVVTIVAFGLLIGLFIGILNYRGAFDGLWETRPVEVEQVLQYGEVRYLLWSNGEITLDAESSREFLLRALILQSDMKKDSNQE